MIKLIKKIFPPSKKNLEESVNDIINSSQARADSSADEVEMFENLIEFKDLKASEVMVPRTEIISADVKISAAELKKLFTSSGHTRIPLYSKNLDDMVGFIHVKDFMPYIGSNIKNFSIKKEMRELIYIPRSMKIIDLLKKMKEKMTHIAIVLDEFGGTDGLVTIEDLIEEIIGDIQDEHDDENDQDMIVEEKSGFLIDSRADIESVEERLEVSLSEEEGEYETFGGFVLSYLGRIPVKGEEFDHTSGLKLKVVDADVRKIKKVFVSSPK